MRVARVWAIPAALLAGAVAARGILAAAPSRIAVDLSQPIPVATDWNGYGALHLGLLACALAAGALAYAATLRALARGDEALSLRAVVAVSLCALAAAALWPLLFSSDVYAYAAYGDLAARGLDPYARGATGSDALMRAALWQWGGAIPACVYGPLFVALARAVVVVASAFGALAQLDALRAVAGLALVACAPLAYAAFAGRPRAERLFAAAAIALNPLAVWSAAEGHNDAIVVALALGGIAAVRRLGPGAGAFLAALSLGVKAPGAAGLFAALYAARRPSRALGFALAGGTLALLLIAAVARPFLPDVFAPGAHGPYAPHVSVQAIWIPLGLAAALAALLVGVRSLARGDAAGWALLALAGWLAIPNPQPWYGLWFLPIAALAPRSAAARTLLGLSLTTFLRYVPDAVALPGAPADIALSLAAFAPLASLCLPSRSNR